MRAYRYKYCLKNIEEKEEKAQSINLREIDPLISNRGCLQTHCHWMNSVTARGTERLACPFPFQLMIRGTAWVVQRSLLASLSDSRSARMSPILTGPFTFLTKPLVGWLMNTTFTCVIPPLDPIRKGHLGGPKWSLLTSFAENLVDGGVCDFRTIHIFAGAWDRIYIINNCFKN